MSNLHADSAMSDPRKLVFITPGVAAILKVTFFG